ncbi:vitamin K-dependent gamma-carboxylase-like isoform X1 [Argiope bruennichi]|uniref:vitamin K-dependent gamma-carboxylase-like isoform X1 n=1 Tax=Argiope bruennichi TaxID=94029 RepID=UPI0024940844|nr:vitamin K-dependent gamma-carboxylase-like isoform X1 [Argiope bruennichi]
METEKAEDRSSENETKDFRKNVLERCIWLRNRILKELGIRVEDLSSFQSFTRLLHKPRDPSNLAVIRILYGFLMIIDVHHERGLSSADSRWGNPSECRFPFFNFLKPLPVEWMIMIYLLMLLGASGILLGYKYRLSCLCFLVPYWYIFFLDKSHWNNHSYLFGLIGTQLMVSGANRCWSLDGKKNPKIRNKHVPLWNYALLRGQIFLVYFIAGLKKTNLDWIGGYSMEKLGYHWVFDGFRIFLTDDQITYFVVHLGGFLLDLTVGFFMLMEFSRPYAFLFCGMFNLMNSRMFAIGMFPYVMIAIMPIFCASDWPKKVLVKLPKLRELTLYDAAPGRSEDCIYTEQEVVPEKQSGSPEKECAASTKTPSLTNVRFRHKVTALLFCVYFCLQGFLPYSHSFTKGYNTWTQGLYGYSWDMMVHNWRYVHTTITVIDKNTGQHSHLDPEAWTRSHRWTHHADMVKQFAHCIQERVAEMHNLKNIELYIDVWLSLNRRFTQRMYDPSVDILTADWSPFEEVTWVLPLQTELTDWRQNLVDMEERIFNQSEDVDVVFVTDFPGFHLLNYVSENHENTTLEVMKGTVEVQLGTGEIIELKEGQSIQIPSGIYHRVSPLKYSPACYMYIYFINKTDLKLTDSEWQGSSKAPTCPASYPNFQVEPRDALLSCKGVCWERIKKDFKKKFQIWTRSMELIGRALYSILTRRPMSIETNTRQEYEEEI